MEPHAQRTAQGVRDRFVADHHRLDELLGRTMRAIEANDREAIEESFTEFDSRLRTHLEAEERFLIPLLARSNARGGQTLIAEHRHIRARLLELATAIDLHTLRLSTARAFAGELKAHAAHEDRLLYEYVDERLPESERASLFAALVDRVASRIGGVKTRPHLSTRMRQ